VPVGDEIAAIGEMGERLCAEFGYRLAQTNPTGLDRDDADRFGALSQPEEELIAAARRCLIRLMAAVMAKRRPVISETTLRALPDGAEMVMRMELARGVLPSKLMPGFVFLVMLPMVDRSEAIELSSRAEALLDEALG
jgi:hypothetical protein